MAINKKLIHFKNLADFETRLANNEILNTSIVFIQDAKKIWTHGTFYNNSDSNSFDGALTYVKDIFNGESFDVVTGEIIQDSNSLRTSIFTTLGDFKTKFNFSTAWTGILRIYSWNAKGEYLGGVDVSLNNATEYIWPLNLTEGDQYFAFSFTSENGVLPDVLTTIFYDFVDKDDLKDEIYIWDIGGNTSGNISKEELNKIIQSKSVIIRMNNGDILVYSKNGSENDFVTLNFTDIQNYLKYSISATFDADLNQTSWNLISNDFNPINKGEEIYNGLPVVRKTSTQTTQNAKVNTAYIWRGTGPSSITVTLPASTTTAATQSKTEEILLEFQVPASSFSLTFNGTVTWANNEIPIFEVGGTYQIHLTARHVNSSNNTVTWLAICSPKFNVTYV